MSGLASSRAVRVGAPLLLVLVLVLAAAWLSREVGESRAVVDGVEIAAPLDAGVEAAPAALDAGGPPDAAYRYDERGRLARPPSHERFLCRRPPIEIVQAPGCASARPYPACRWQLPEQAAAADLYEVWRNTTPEHRWARPGLIALVMAAAAEYAERWPGEHVTIGDLDAPGPRHQTHDRGVDVDLYLLEAMIARNEGGGRYPDNYEGRSRREVRQLRARVMDLAKILATCAGGQIRIYYNDPDLIRPFRTWFDEQGMHSDVGRPMRMHNDLHRFHFHLTVPEDLPVLPERLPWEGE